MCHNMTQRHIGDTLAVFLQAGIFPYPVWRERLQ